MAINKPGQLLSPSVSNSAGSGSQLPWSTNANDVYFPFINIDGDKWDKLFPYRFLVVDASNNNTLVNSPGSTIDVSYRSILDSAQINVTIANRWEARLPITPQMFSTQSLFAITNTPGLRGILEEHGGLRYKDITMSGTTGIYPAKAFNGNVPKKSSIESIFAGTIAAANSVRATLDTIKGGNYQAPPINQIDTTQTGYYHAMFIEQFIEQYVLMKKKPECKSWRLVLDIPKQGTSYYVTPLSSNITQSAQKPNEWQFSFQLRAWKRVSLGQDSKPQDQISMSLTLSDYQKVVNGISSARLAIQQSINTVKAVRNDVLGVVNNLRQISLLVKDTATLAHTAADMPRQLIKDAQSSISEAALTLPLGNMSEYDRKNMARLKSAKTTAENLSLTQVKSNAQGRQASHLVDASPAYNPFSSPETSFTLLNAIPTDSISLSLQQQDALQNDIDLIRDLTVQDIKNKRNDLYNLYLDLSDKLGTNSDLVNSIYNRPKPSPRPYPLTIDESNLLHSLFEAIQAYDTITATRELDTSKTLSPMKFVKELSDQTNVDFDDYPSKILAPVPFNLSPEQIAQRYLKDKDKWIEIATLNSLRAPFIDEDGFVYQLLTNGDGRQFTVPSNENLYVGQKITLSSSTVFQFNRKISKIEKITNNNYLITTDGLANLDDLKTTDRAQMKAYLPGTVNSQDMIFIPTTTPPDSSLSPTITDGVPQDSLTLMSRVDFLLDDNMDVALDGNGDFRFASGLTNLIQTLKVMFVTQKGSILSHPDFGLGVKPGISISNVDNNQLFKDINGMIMQDGRFSRVKSITIDLDGPQMLITIVVEPKGANGVMPISFIIPRT